MGKFQPWISKPLNINEVIEGGGTILPGDIISFSWLIIRTIAGVYCIILSIWSIAWLFLHTEQLSWITLFANWALAMNAINLSLNSFITYKIWEKSGYELIGHESINLTIHTYKLDFEWKLTTALSHISVAGSLLMCFVYWIFVRLHMEEFEKQLSISTILDIQTHLASSVCVFIEFALSLFQPSYLEGVFDILICDSIFMILTFMYTWFKDFTIDWDGLLDKHYIISFITVFIGFHILLHYILTFIKNTELYIWYLRINYKINNNLLNINHEMLFTDSNEFNGGKKGEDYITISFGSNIQQRYNKLLNLNAMIKENPDIIVLLGDNIYLDEIPKFCCLFNNKNVNKIRYWNQSITYLQQTILKQKVNLKPSIEYNNLLNHKHFILPIKTQNQINKNLPLMIATWNKHDFIKNNKIESKKGFVKFLENIDYNNELCEAIDDINKQQNRGIYYYHDYHNDLLNGSHLFIKFIVLDTQFNNNNNNNNNNSIIGDEQFKWLNDVVLNDIITRDDKPDWNVIVCGQSILQHSKIDPKLIFPDNDVDKLFNLLHYAGILKNTILLTGNLLYSQCFRFNNVYEISQSSFINTLPWWKPKFTFMQKYMKRGQRVSNICINNGYGTLKISKNSWKYMHKDYHGRASIPLSKDIDI